MKEEVLIVTYKYFPRLSADEQILHFTLHSAVDLERFVSKCIHNGKSATIQCGRSLCRQGLHQPQPELWPGTLD